jgi:hypothetical protein
MLAERFVRATARYTFWCSVVGAFAIVVSFSCTYTTSLWFSAVECFVSYFLALIALNRTGTGLEKTCES